MPFLPVSRGSPGGLEVFWVFTKYFSVNYHLAGFIRLVVLLSDLMRSVKLPPSRKAELAGTLFVNLRRVMLHVVSSALIQIRARFC